MDGWTDGWMAAGGGGERERFSGVNVVYEFFSFSLCNGTCSCADHQLKKKRGTFTYVCICFPGHSLHHSGIVEISHKND